jgi:hypothetical protein
MIMILVYQKGKNKKKIVVKLCSIIRVESGQFTAGGIKYIYGVERGEAGGWFQERGGGRGLKSGGNEVLME